MNDALVLCRQDPEKSTLSHNEYIFLGDNAPFHRPNIVKTYKETSQINETEWPAHSLDMNIIENIWLKIKRDIVYQTSNVTIHNNCLTLLGVPGKTSLLTSFNVYMKQFQVEVVKF